MSNKVAVKSGYYFEIFDKEELPSTLIKDNRKVKLNNEKYDLYKGNSIEDEKKIDDMFGDRMGYSIDDNLYKPKCALIGEDGNIFNLMGIASRTLKRNEMQDASKEMCSRVMNSKSYDDALAIIDEYVDICSKEELEEDEEEC